MMPHDDSMHMFGSVWMILIGILLVIPFWRLCQRLGFPGALSLLVLVPLANIFLIYFLAFSRWPASREREGS